MANHNAGGNARKSLDQHKLDGTYRKDRHGAIKNPEPPTGRPEIPAELCEVAHAEWDRMMWRLEQSQSVTKVDDAVVFQYCRLYAETETVAELQSEAQASLKILEENVREIAKTDLMALFQEIGAMRKLISKCTDQLRNGRMAIRQYLVEFGLTPASRSRIKLPPAPPAVDEFSAMQQARPTVTRMSRVK